MKKGEILKKTQFFNILSHLSFNLYANIVCGVTYVPSPLRPLFPLCSPVHTNPFNAYEDWALGYQKAAPRKQYLIKTDIGSSV